MSWYAVVKLMESKYQEEIVLYLLVWDAIVWKWVRNVHVYFCLGVWEFREILCLCLGLFCKLQVNKWLKMDIGFLYETSC